MDDDNLRLLLAWMVHCIIRPGKASPIAILTGPAGAAKSSLLQLVVDLLDPKAGLRAGMPTKEDDLVVAAHQGAVVSYDNASTLNLLSDALCRLATGGGLRKRTLFTDKDVTAIDVLRPVIIAGIDPVAHQQDLIERLVIITLRPPAERIDDETLGEMVDEARPRLLGFLLNLVSQVLALPRHPVQTTRMDELAAAVPTWKASTIKSAFHYDFASQHGVPPPDWTTV